MPGWEYRVGGVGCNFITPATGCARCNFDDDRDDDGGRGDSGGGDHGDRDDDGGCGDDGDRDDGGGCGDDVQNATLEKVQ